MQANLKLGHIWGIPIGVHWSWFLVFGLVTWSLAWGYLPREYPELSPLAAWLLGGLTSLLFFGSIVLHELGHSWVALRNQIPVRSVNLFIFGGVAHIAQEPRTPGVEFRVAIAGPLTSLALAVIFAGVWWMDQAVSYLAAPSLWLARINLTVALFNLIPGFPLDGGRVLRALVWKINGSLPRATKVAAFTGQLFAFGFMGLGVLTILGGNTFNGLWLVFIGWFLQNAAASSYAQTDVHETLRGVPVGRVMLQEAPQIGGDLTLAKLIAEHVLPHGQRCFVVAAHSQPLGLLTLSDITHVPQARWERVTAAQVMVPWERVVQTRPDADVFTALEAMDDANVAQVPVVQDGTILGLLSRERILHYIRIRAELRL